MTSRAWSRFGAVVTPRPIHTTQPRNQATAAADEAVEKEVGGTRRAVRQAGTRTPPAPAR